MKRLGILPKKANGILMLILILSLQYILIIFWLILALVHDADKKEKTGVKT